MTKTNNEVQALELLARDFYGRLEATRTEALHSIEELARSLQAEVDACTWDPTRLPSTDLMTSSLVTDVTRRAAMCETLERALAETRAALRRSPKEER